MIDISVIIPVYNEEENIQTLVKTLDEYLANQKFKTEVVFVDDGSTDNSVSSLKKANFNNAEKKIVKLSKNFGAHAALRAGIQNVDSDNCVFYYMDMSNDVSVIGELYELLKEGNELAYVERIDYKGSLGSKIFTKLVNKFIASDFPESGVTSVAFGKKIKDALNQHIEKNSSLFFQIFRLGFKKAGIKRKINEREIGTSKWTLSKKMNLFIDSFVMFSNAPIRFVSILGFIFAFIGILAALFTLIIKVFDLFTLSAGWPTLISVIMIGFGVTNLSLGVISEYLVRTLEAAQDRPVFIVDELIEFTNKENK
ncbi:MAG: glycosyltransferase [Anaerovoracaceae bacterium]